MLFLNELWQLYELYRLSTLYITIGALEVVEYNLLEWMKIMSPKVTCVARVTLAFFCIDFNALIYILVFYSWDFLLKPKYFV